MEASCHILLQFKQNYFALLERKYYLSGFLIFISISSKNAGATMVIHFDYFELEDIMDGNFSCSTIITRAGPRVCPSVCLSVCSSGCLSVGQFVLVSLCYFISLSAHLIVHFQFYRIQNVSEAALFCG